MVHYAKVKETVIPFNFYSTHDMFHHIQDKWTATPLILHSK